MVLLDPPPVLPLLLLLSLVVFNIVVGRPAAAAEVPPPPESIFCQLLLTQLLPFGIISVFLKNVNCMLSLLCKSRKHKNWHLKSIFAVGENQKLTTHVFVGTFITAILFVVLCYTSGSV
jgi:uncharacterized BrkB/YihY/UPF0761 family membrane protein